jgi:hypothetical protein
MNNAAIAILNAIQPSKSEPLVTYTIPNGAGRNIYVKMPRLFVDFHLFVHELILDFEVFYVVLPS